MIKFNKLIHCIHDDIILSRFSLGNFSRSWNLWRFLSLLRVEMLPITEQLFTRVHLMCQHDTECVLHRQLLLLCMVLSPHDELTCYHSDTMQRPLSRISGCINPYKILY